MSKYYVNPQTFRLELISSNIDGKLTPKCLDMLLLMIDKIQGPYHYEMSQDREDCRSSAIETVLKNWKKYDIERPNPFAYFTRMIYNGLYAGWNELTRKRADVSISAIFSESL